MRAIHGITLGLLLVGFATPSRATAPLHVWSERFGGTTDDQAVTVAVDGFGNVVVSGDFTGTANFGGGNLVSVGATDILLAKYDANGAHLWSKRLGGASFERTIVAAVDGSGNIVLTGFFGGTADFGGGPLASAGSNDIFLAKYDASGAHLWSKRFGGVGVDNGWGVTVDGLGTIAVTGTFSGTVDFGGGPLVSAGINDVFLAEYAASGVHQWSKRFGGTGSDSGISVAVDGAGNVVMLAQFSATVDFGGGPLVSAGGLDIAMTKYDASGAHQWSKRFGGSFGDQPASVGVDGSDNIVLSGIFSGSVDFGGGPLASAGGFDIILAKYDASGAHLWSQRFGDTGTEIVETVAVDGAGSVAITGFFDDTVDFGGGPLASAASNDIFLAKYDASGAHTWSQAFGDSLNDNGNSIAVAGPGSVVATGFFSGTVDFGGGDLVSDGGYDVYIAKFDDQVIVPVLISRFNAATRPGGIDLTWEFSSDEALAGFTLYRNQGRTPSVVIAGGDAKTTRSYTDASVAPGETYHYELVIRTAGGDEFRSTVATATMPRAVTTLAQNFPNPFNPQTTIEYTVGERVSVSIEVFDATGTRVRLLDEGVRQAGTYRATWDGRDADNRSLSSGVYFYRLAGVKGAETRKMVLLK